MENNYVVDIVLKARDQTGTALTSVQSKLKGLEGGLQAVDEKLSKFDRSFRETSRGLKDDLNRSLQKIGASIDDTNTKSDKLMRTFREQTKAVSESEKALEKLNEDLGENGNAVDNAQKRVKTYITQINTLERDIRDLSVAEGDHTDKIEKKTKALRDWENRARINLDLLRDYGNATDGLNQTEKTHTDMLGQQEAQMRSLRDQYIKLNDERSRAQDVGATESIKDMDRQLEQLEQRAVRTYKAIDTLKSKPTDSRFRTLMPGDEDEVELRKMAAAEIEKIAEKEFSNMVTVERKKRSLIADTIEAEKKAERDRIQAARDSRAEETKALAARASVSESIRKDLAQRAKDEKKIRQEETKSLADFIKLQDDRLKAVRKAEDDIERITKAGAKNRAERNRLEASGASPEQLASLDKDYSSIKDKGTRAMASRDRAANMDVSTGDPAAKMALLKRQIESVDGKYKIEWDVDMGKAIADLMLLNAAKNKAAEAPRQGMIASFFDKISAEANRSRNSIAQFDNNLRGMAVFAAVLSLQQLITVLMAAGAQLVAIASSAIMAGGALAGGLTAGAAQAIPMIGILAASLARLGAVFEAVKQADLLKQQQFGEAAKGDQAAADNTDALANANDGLTSALDGVADAQRNLAEAQMDLVRARFASSRQLEDMILQEKEAALAAQGAVLSQRDSKRALQESIAQGDVGSLASDRLDIKGANLDVRSTRLDSNRASQDLALQQSGSPLRPDRGVEEAQKAIEDARRALLDAQRAADGARRSLKSAATGAAVAGAAGLASASKMDYMLKQMSDSERKFYRAVTGLKDTYEKAFRPVTDIMVDAFTRGAKRSEKVLKDPALMGAMKGLSGSMASGLDQITKEFTNPGWIRFFTTMTKEAGKNVEPMVDTFLALGRTFRNIAEAASPLWGRMVGWVKEGAEAFEDWVGKGDSLVEFFDEGEEHLKSWMGLIGAVGELFLELIGASADSGKESVEDLTKQVESATKWIQDHGKEVANFFAEAQDVMEEVGEVIIDLGAAMFRLFDPKSVEALAEIFSDILIPAFEKTIAGFGAMFKFMEKIAQVPGAKQLLQMAVIGALAAKVMHALAGSFRGLIVFVEKFIGPVFRMGKVFLGLGSAQEAAAVGSSRLFSVMMLLSNPMTLIAIAAAALVAGFVLLSQKFGVWDEVVGAAKESFRDFIKLVKDPFRDFMKSISRVTGALSEVASGSNALGKVFQWVFVNVVRSVIIPVLREFGEMVGKTIGGVLKVFGGFINVVMDIFEGKWSDIPGHVKDMLEGLWMIVSGAFQRLTLPIRIFGAIAWKLLKAGFNKLVDLAKDLPGFLWDQLKKLPDLARKAVTSLARAMFGGLGPKLVNGFRNAFDTIWDFLKKMPGRMVDAGVNVAKGFARGIGKLPGLIGDAFKGAGKIIGEIAGSITKFINDKTKFGDEVDLGLFSIDLPALPEKFAKGGPVGGSGDGDTVRALLTPGEHVWTKGEVAAAGGHGAVYAMRSAFGGGSQSKGRAYAEGGAVQAAKSATVGSAGGMTLADLLSVINDFGSEANNSWMAIWTKIRKTTSNATKQIENDAEDALGKIAKTSNRQLGKMVQAFTGSMRKAQGVVKEGFSYILDTTNKALDAFGVETLSVSLEDPKKGKAEERRHGGFVGGFAGGGFVGNRGERGGDKVPAWIGRGEAVLNYAHQRMVEPAMRKMYGMGLGGMFKSVGAAHGAAREGGYAEGGYPNGGFDVDGAKPGFVPFMNWLNKMFGPIYTMSGLRPGSITTSGNVSNHSSGNAVDISTHQNGLNFADGEASLNATGAAATRMDALHAFMAKHVKLPGDFLWRTFTGGNHFNHIHRGITSAEADDPQKMMAYISTLPEGGMFDRLKKMKVLGNASPIKSILQVALDKAVKAANGYVTDKVSVPGFGPGSTNELHGAGVSGSNQEMGKQLMSQMFGADQWPALKELWTRESGWDEGATNPSSGAYGIPQSLPASKMGPAAQGTGPAAAKAQIIWGLNYIKERYGSPGEALAFHDSNNWYTKGKQVLREAVPMLADKGFDFKAVAGIMGNAYGESNWDTEAMEPGTDNGGLFGFTAYEKSMAALRSYADKTGQKWNEVKTQIEFMLKSGGLGTKGAMNDLDSIPDTTKYFMDDYEKPGTPRLSARISGGFKAADIMKELKLMTAGAGGDESEKASQKVKDVQQKLSDKEFIKVLPKSLRPAARDFDGWFTKKFGKDPTSVRYGKTTGIMGDIRESVSSWASDFLDQARSYTATKKGDQVLETSLYDPDDEDEGKKKRKKKKKGKNAAARMLGKVQEFATGGTVKGSLGEPVGIIAHAGEMVLNQAQQALLGGADYLKRILGFDGKPKSSFSDGGLVGGTITGRIAKVGMSAFGSIGDPMREFGTPMEEFVRGIRGYSKDIKSFLNQGSRLFKKKGVDLSNVVAGMFDRLTGEGGVLDVLGESFESFSQMLANNLGRASVKINAQGRVIGRGLQAEEIIAREAKNINKELTLLMSEKGIINKAMQKAKQALRIARRRGDTAAEEAAQAAINNLEDRQLENDSEIVAKRLEALQKMEEKLQAWVENINEKADDKAMAVDLAARIAAATGQEGLGITQTLQQASIDAAKQQIASLQKALEVARKQGNEEMAKELERQIAELGVVVLEGAAALIANAADYVQKDLEKASTSAGLKDRWGQVASGFGKTEWGNAVQGAALRETQGGLGAAITAQQGVIAAAEAAGLGDSITGPLKDTLNDLIAQLAENALAIFENTIQQRQLSIDLVSNRQSFFGGVSDGLKSIVESVGTANGTVDLPLLTNIMTKALDQLKTTGDLLRDQMTRFVGEAGGGLPASVRNILSNLQGLRGNDFVNAINGLDQNAIVAMLGGQDSPLAQQFEALLQQLIDNEAAIQANTNELAEATKLNKIQSFTSTAWTWFRSAIFNGMGGLLPQYSAGTPYYDTTGMSAGGMAIGDGPRHLHNGEVVVPTNFSRALLTLARTGAIANDLSDGSLQGTHIGSKVGAGMSTGMSQGLALESNGAAYDRLRRALLANSQNIETHIHEAESGTDATYLSERIAHAAKIPTT